MRYGGQRFKQPKSEGPIINTDKYMGYQISYITNFDTGRAITQVVIRKDGKVYDTMGFFNDHVAFHWAIRKIKELTNVI